MKKLNCFVMVLGYSRMRYIEFVTDMSTNILIRCHAFRYFHGYREEILYDHMKQVGIKRLLKKEDSTLNVSLRTFPGSTASRLHCVDHRGGQTKGKVERTVAFVRDE